MMTAIENTLLRQAQNWKAEAMCQASIVRECYQACTGSTGEPGDWNGAAPIRAAIAAKNAEIAALRKDAALGRFVRSRLTECDGGWAIAHTFIRGAPSLEDVTDALPIDCAA
jgi:hypothetical protein